MNSSLCFCLPPDVGPLPVVGPVPVDVLAEPDLVPGREEPLAVHHVVAHQPLEGVGVLVDFLQAGLLGVPTIKKILKRK